MKSLLILFVLLPAANISAQMPAANELYQKIEKYYLQNPGSVEYVERKFKPVLSYDTLRSRIAFVSLSNENFLIMYLDSNYYIKNALLFSDDYYELPQDFPEKIKVRKAELQGTMYSKLEKFPSHYFDNLESIFGRVKLLQKANDQYIAFPKKPFLETPISGGLTSVLKIDTLTYRITTLIQTASYRGNIQYEEYNYLILSNSTEKFIKEQAIALAESSKNFPLTTFKEMDKRIPPPENFEGKSFVFKNLVSFNKGPIDSVASDKYVIFDFFYQSCLPCHKMTGYILDWLPSVDSSKIALVGIDPTDSEWSMKLFVKDKKISYPIIIGQQAKNIVHYYQIHGYPTLFLLSPDGKIQTVHVGMSKSFLTKAEKIVSR
jgi:thiol-disulfide isomerase/thioredoxin